MTEDVVKRAAEFAKTAHESIDQRRKYSNLPYIVHPEAVAHTVASVTDDAAMIAAAWLHDVVEDTPVTIDQVREEFGEDIAKLVSDLTDVSRMSDGNRKQRTSIDRAHTANADPRAKTVKLADLIDNLSNIVNEAPDFAPLYLSEKELLMQVLKEGDRTLYKRVETIIVRSRHELQSRKS